MTALQRTVVAIGALDLTHVAWVAWGTLSSTGLLGLWQNIVAFGSPLPVLQFAGILFVYLTILACGLALIFRRSELTWLNYVLFPLRLLLAIPTLFPLFVGLSASGLTLHPSITFVLLFTTEVLRVILVHRWSRHSTAEASVAGVAV